MRWNIVPQAGRLPLLSGDTEVLVFPNQYS